MLGKKKKSNNAASKNNTNSNVNVNISNNNLSKKEQKKQKRMSKRKEKIDMYDMIIANLIAGNSIIEPTEKLNSSQLSIGFSNIASDEQLSKYFMISKFPDFMQTQFIDIVRRRCIRPGVKINFYFYAKPHIINWDSPEMKNRMSIWRRYSANNSGPIDVFSYRTQRGESLARNRIITSTKYLNEAELDQKRSLVNVFFIIEVSAKRTEDALINMSESIKSLKTLCNASEIKLVELRINMIDWLRAIGPFSLKMAKELISKFSRKVLTDDVLANFNSYRQGRVGLDGIPLGLDVLSGSPVLNKFKRDPSGADNWLISAETGGGKSYWIKVLLSYLLAEGFVCCVMDYEGDEYQNFANYIKAGNPDDVKIISMGKGSTIYFDPCEIPDLTGDPDVDDDLKEGAISFIESVFRVIVCGTDGDFTKEQERVLSLAIQRMYDTVGVTDDKYTWHRSKGLRLHDIYNEIKNMVESKELVDGDADNTKHKAATYILDSTSIYFEEGEAKSGTFKNPMSANSLYKAKFIVFSFGMKGASNSAMDNTLLALKQLSVAYVNIQISNYCKYVKKCFNVKIWEEFQRWIAARGSAETIVNVITGGRKRGDVNFIITNDLASLLDGSNPVMQTLRLNIQNYAIGKIKDKGTRDTFCKLFDLQECKLALDKIAKAHMENQSGTAKVSGANNRYKHAFCVMLEDGKKAVVKVKLPEALVKSDLFETGVKVKDNK